MRMRSKISFGRETRDQRVVSRVPGRKPESKRAYLEAAHISLQDFGGGKGQGERYIKSEDARGRGNL